MTDTKLADSASTRIICGSGRSGTTWVQDCLAEANGLRPIFEPLHPVVTPLGEEYAYRVLDPIDPHPRLYEYLQKIFRGDYNSLWTDYRARRDEIFPPLTSLGSIDEIKRWVRRWRRHLDDRSIFRKFLDRRFTLTKFIRANLMIDWLKRRFNAKIVLVIRHPAAVVESKLRLRGPWDPVWMIDRYRNDVALGEILGEPYDRLLQGNLSAAGQLTLCWCIENISPAARPAGLDRDVVYYEELRYGGMEHWQNLSDALALDHCPRPEDVSRPSQKAARSASSMHERSDSAYWLKRLDDAALREIRHVLETLECSLYHIDRLAPAATSFEARNVRMA